MVVSGLYQYDCACDLSVLQTSVILIVLNSWHFHDLVFMYSTKGICRILLKCLISEFPCHISSVPKNMEREGILVDRTSENGSKPAGLVHSRLTQYQELEVSVHLGFSPVFRFIMELKSHIIKNVIFLSFLKWLCCF